VLRLLVLAAAPRYNPLAGGRDRTRYAFDD
jgi:hypothetical protein